jgi:hypothetical protein
VKPLYRVYAERIASLLAAPPEGPWDGVFTSLEK